METNRYVVQHRNNEACEWEIYTSFSGRIEAIEKMLQCLMSDNGNWRVAYLEWNANPITPELTRSQKEH